MKTTRRLLKICLVLSLIYSCSADESLQGTENQPEEQSTEKIHQGFVELQSQAEVDDFADEAYTKVNGNFMLIGSTITNIDELSSLKEINGDIYVLGTGLENIDGLKNVNSKEGIYMEVINNKDLMNLDGFQSITVTIESIEIRGNTKLNSIEGIKNISGINYFLGISDTDGLTDLDALSGIENELDYVSITNNKSLIDTRGMGNIPFIKDFFFAQNYAIVSLNGLEHLEEVGELSINRNQNLKNINGLANIVSATGFDIHDNPSLENLDGLSNLEYLSGGRASMNSNISLKDFCGLSLLSSVSNSLYDIQHNYYNPTKEDIENGDCRIE